MLKPTLEIDGFDDARDQFTGTIIVDGAPMRVWVPDDLAEASMQPLDAAGDVASDSDDVPF